jgi:uncharacterized membrane protein YfcA
LAAIIIGLSLGLIGGGGSILAVPILVYLFKINPEQATSYSLFIVGFTAMIGSFSHHKLGNLKIKSALVLLFLYFIFATSQNYAATSDTLFLLIALTLQNLLIMIVAFLMIATSVSMIRKSRKSKQKINFYTWTFIAWVNNRF